MAELSSAGIGLAIAPAVMSVLKIVGPMLLDKMGSKKKKPDPAAPADDLQMKSRIADVRKNPNQGAATFDKDFLDLQYPRRIMTK
jgi:hypothetical protein